MPSPLRNRRIILPPLVTNNATGPVLTPPVTSGLVLQLDANQGTSTTTPGASVSSWNDVSSTAAVFSQGTGANQPTYQAAVKNGLPIVRFSGSQWLITSGAVSALNNFSSRFSIFVVAKTSASPFAVQKIISNEDNTLHKGWGLGPSNNNKWAGYYGNNTANQKVEANTDITTWHIVTYTGNNTGTTERVYEDGTQINSAASDPMIDQTTQPCCVGAASDNTANNRWTGDLGEILVYNRLVTGGEQTSIESYLRTKWGTP